MWVEVGALGCDFLTTPELQRRHVSFVLRQEWQSNQKSSDRLLITPGFLPTMPRTLSLCRMAQSARSNEAIEEYRDRTGHQRQWAGARHFRYGLPDVEREQCSANICYNQRDRENSVTARR